MMKRLAVMAVAAIVAGMGFVGQAVSQDQPASAPSGDRQNRMQQYRQQMSERMKTAMGATDDEWKVLQPKIEKVMTLSREARGGMMGMMFGGRGRGGSGGDANLSETQKKAQALQKVLENKEAKLDEIKAALAEYRAAKAKAKEELAKAQKELQEVLSVKQEAQLVAYGLLD